MDLFYIISYIILKLIWIVVLMAGYREVEAVKSIKLNVAYIIGVLCYMAGTNNTFYLITNAPQKILATAALIAIGVVLLRVNTHYRIKYEVYEDTPTIILKKIAALVKNFKEPINLKKRRAAKVDVTDVKDEV